MKRIIGVVSALCALACVLTLAGCKGGGNKVTTTLSAQEQAVSEEEFSSSLAAARNVVGEEIGKTEKNKKLVMLFNDTSMYYKYEVLYFKDGVADYKLTYYLFHDLNGYNDMLDMKKQMFHDIQEKDKNLLMIVDKNAKQVPAPYQDCYDVAAERDSLTIVE